MAGPSTRNRLAPTWSSLRARTIHDRCPCAPRRASFAGGGSDIAAFYRQRRVAVLSCAIAKSSPSSVLQREQISPPNMRTESRHRVLRCGGPERGRTCASPAGGFNKTLKARQKIGFQLQENLFCGSTLNCCHEFILFITARRARSLRVAACRS
jgi:hypothetical protein